MTRYKCIVEYDGTNFHGWQRQNGFSSIQQSIEEAIVKFAQEEVEVYASGRTDAGVHALGQVIHFDINKEMPKENVMGALNYHLRPNPIAILDIEEVDKDFHARFDAKERSYIYKMVTRRAPLALDVNRVWQLPRELDIDLMQEAAEYFIGKHDFTSFRAVRCEAKSPVKTIDELTISRKDGYIIVCIRAKSFLHHMVRNIVGTLKLVGDGRWSPQQVKDAIDAKDRRAAGPTAPAHGLYFEKVVY
ncbi:tRNA pseudouridine(38-40) synthase TruA [Rickettsiales bacterium]|nr:tRNA pseudouridine(38-40) synthase TruA [Rickettsiales bacterium]